mmetsp:Transcript_168663/g.536327  ORF Transcript_168663/g.536327 Transcript_168663/m.536327 type:complete len:239 (-) Transcript_168663:2224-2940(-)
MAGCRAKLSKDLESKTRKALWQGHRRACDLSASTSAVSRAPSSGEVVHTPVPAIVAGTSAAALADTAATHVSRSVAAESASETRSMAKSNGFADRGSCTPQARRLPLRSSAGPSQSVRPPCPSSKMRLKSGSKSARGWCTVQATVCPRSRTRFFSSCTSCCAARASRPVVGSSSSRTAGSPRQAIKTLRRLRSPPLMPPVPCVPTRVERQPLKPNASTSPRTRWSRLSASVWGNRRDA